MDRLKVISTHQQSKALPKGYRLTNKNSNLPQVYEKLRAGQRLVISKEGIFMEPAILCSTNKQFNRFNKDLNKLIVCCKKRRKTTKCPDKLEKLLKIRKKLLKIREKMGGSQKSICFPIKLPQRVVKIVDPEMLTSDDQTLVVYRQFLRHFPKADQQFKLMSGEGKASAPLTLITTESEVIRAVVENGWKKEKTYLLDQSDQDYLELVCEFVKFGKTKKISGKNVLEVYRVADKLGIKGLMKASEKFLLTKLSKKNIDMESLPCLWKFSNEQHLNELKLMCFDYYCALSNKERNRIADQEGVSKELQSLKEIFNKVKKNDSAFLITCNKDVVMQCKGDFYVFEQYYDDELDDLQKNGFKICEFKNEYVTLRMGAALNNVEFKNDIISLMKIFNVSEISIGDVKIGQRNINKKNVTFLVDLINSNEDLVSLNFSNCHLWTGIKKEDADALQSAIASRKKLKSLNFRACDLGRREVNWISNLLSQHKGIESFKIDVNSLKDKEIKTLMNALKECDNLRELDLSTVNWPQYIGFNALTEITEFLETNKGIKLLGLNVDDLDVGKNEYKAFENTLRESGVHMAEWVSL